MMDYLLRDGYFTGAEHAKIDHNRITYSLDVYKNKLALDTFGQLFGPGGPLQSHPRPMVPKPLNRLPNDNKKNKNTM